jgi:signal transduction histidine kinase
VSTLTSDIRSTIEAELRLSAKWISALLVAAGLYVFLVGDIQFQSVDRFGLLLFSVVSLVGAGLIWFLDGWQSRWGQWFAIVMIVGVVHFGTTLFGWAVHSFASIAIILAIALAGSPGATVAVLGETALLFAYTQLSPSRFESINLVVESATLWSTWLAVMILTNPVQSITQWSWEQYRKIEELLEEARNQRADLKRAMEDLVYANRQQMLLNERITVMRLAAEEAQKAKAVFVARVSHEFRTPLNMIIGLIDSVMESPEIYGEDLPAALIQDLEIVHRNCMHLAGMINDVLDLSKTDAARMTLRRDWVDLAAEVSEVLAVTQPLLEKKRLQLFSEIGRDLPPVFCDRIRIRQVIINLISNAIRFTDKGSVTIKLAAEAGGIVVSVSDTGAGIEKNEVEKVFDPFFQANRNSLHGTGGTGLGLTISKYLIEMHAGKIWLTSELGKGSIFSFWLPQHFPDSSIAIPQLRWQDSPVPDERKRAGERAAPIYPERFVIWDDLGGLETLISRPADRFEFVQVRSIEEAR